MSENTVTVTEYGVDGYSVDQWSIKAQDLSNVTLESQSSSVAASSERKITATGVLVAGDANVSGSGESSNLVTATGALVTDDPVVSGTSERTVTATGALTSDNSVVSGSGVGFSVTTATGSLTSDNSVVSGASERTASATGSLTSDNSVVSGSSERVVVSSGTLVADDSVVSGTASQVHTQESAALQSQDATVSGIALHVHTSESAALQAQSSSVSGNAFHIHTEESAALQAGSSTVSGRSIRKHEASGALYAGDAESHASVENIIVDFHADLVTSAVTVSGVAERIIPTESIAIQLQDATVNGSTKRTVFSISADLVAGDITLTDVADKVLITSAALQAQESTISGSGFRTGDVPTVELISGDATVDGFGSRGHHDHGGLVVVNEDVTVSGQGIVGRKSSGQLIVTDVSVVNGISERVIVAVEADLTAEEIGISAVVGVGENIIVEGDATMECGPATVSGTGVREKDLHNLTIISQSSSVDATTNITSNSLSATLKASDATVSGIAENTIKAAPIQLVSGDATVVGASARQSNEENASLASGPASVSGTSERVIVAVEADLTAEEIGISAVVGVGENIIVEGDATVESDPAIVSGTGVRHANLLDGTIVSGPSTATLLGERQIVSTGTLVSADAIVTGEAENIINQVGGGQLSAGQSVVSGLAERTVVAIEADISADEMTSSGIGGISERELIEDAELFSEDSKVTGTSVRHANTLSGISQVGESTVNGVSERQSDATGAMESGTASVSGTSERTIVNVPNVGIFGDLVGFGPNDDGPSVSYVDDYTITYSGTGAQYVALTGDRSFTLKVDLGNLVAEETFNSVAKDYNLYFRRISANNYDCIFFVTTTGRWYQEEFTKHPSEWDDGEILEPYVAINTVETTSKDAVREGAASTRLYSSEAYVIAISENIITSVHANLQAGPVVLTSTIKRTLPDTELHYKAPDVTVIGVAERTLNNDGLGHQLVTGPSLVTGVAERFADVDVIALKAQDATIVAVAERILNNDGLGQQLFSGPSTVDATTKRSVFYQSGIAQGGDATVVGVGERILDHDGITHELISGDASVAGVAERTINASGALETTESLVVGISENQHDFESGIAQVDDAKVTGAGVRHANVLDGIDMPDSVAKVVGFAERALNNDGLGQQVQSGPATVNATSERTVVRLPDFEGPLALSPDSNDAQVSYNGTDLVITNMLGHLSFFNGTYQQNPIMGSFSESGNNHVFSVDEFDGINDVHNWYVRRDTSVGGYFWCFYNTTQNNWYIAFTTENPDTWEDGHTTTNTTGLQTEVATNSELRVSGFESMHGDKVTVIGLSERTVNQTGGGNLKASDSQVSSTVEIVSNLLSGIHMPDSEAKVDGVGKVSRLPIVAHIKSDDCFVAGGGENIVVQSQRPNLKTGPVSVVAVVKRTSNGSGVIVSAPSTVSGVAERTLNNDGTPHELVSGPSTLNGVSERVITGSGYAKARMPFIFNEGIAERKIVSISADLKSDDSSTNSDGQNIGERTIVNIPDPALGETRLYSGNNRPWQLVGSTNVEQILDPNADPTIRPRVGGEHTFNPIVHQDLAFQEAIPVYKRILVRAPRKRR